MLSNVSETLQLKLFFGKSFLLSCPPSYHIYLVIRVTDHTCNTTFLFQSYPQYWPSEGSAKYGEVTVQLLSQETSNNITTRGFSVENAAVQFVCSRIVRSHFFWLVWRKLLSIPTGGVCAFLMRESSTLTISLLGERPMSNFFLSESKYSLAER